MYGIFHDNQNKNEGKNIEIDINNKNKMIIYQSESDRSRDGISIDRICEGEQIVHLLISSDEFVMLINYYNYIKDNDIQQDFINPDGYYSEEAFEHSKDIYYEPENNDEVGL